MVTAWTFFGFIMIATNRYLRGKMWKVAIWVHGFFGFVILGFTYAAAYHVLQLELSWNIKGAYDYAPWHIIFGLPVIALSIFLVLGGTCLKIQSNTGKWNTRMI